MKIYALRHGHTNYNQLRLCNGDPQKDVHLTKTGIRQAEAAARELSGIPLERIFVSQLPRTRQTAEILNHYHHVAIESRAEINDILTGFEDRPVKEYQAAIVKDPVRCRPTNGESLLDYRERVLGSLHWLRDCHYSAVAMVVHEETLRIVYGYFNHLKEDDLPSLSFRNCQVLCFET